MDPRIFKEGKMNLKLFGSLRDRCIYHPEDHVLFIDLFGVSLLSEEEVALIGDYFDEIMTPLTETRGPLDVIVNYDGFDLRTGLEESYANAMDILQKKHYKSAKRFAGRAFRCARLKGMLTNMDTYDAKATFIKMDEDCDGVLSREELRAGIRKHFGIRLRQSDLDNLCKSDVTIDNFSDVVGECLRRCGSEFSYRPISF
jgi:hypothetical protein